MSHAFEILDLTVQFGKGAEAVTPLRSLDLDVPKGQFLCILGPSGQGKSTLLRCMAGLLRPTSGTVASFGAKVSGPSADRGMVFQQDAIPSWLRVWDNVALGSRSQKASVDYFIEPSDSREEKDPGQRSFREVCAGGWRSPRCSPTTRTSC